MVSHLVPSAVGATYFPTLSEAARAAEFYLKTGGPLTPDRAVILTLWQPISGLPMVLVEMRRAGALDGFLCENRAWRGRPRECRNVYRDGRCACEPGGCEHTGKGQP